MADLIARSPGAGLFPIAAGGTALAECAWTPIHAVSPFRGREDAVRRALGGWPAPNRWTQAEGRRIAWSGRGQAFVLGEMPDLPDAAVAEQSDACCRVILSGPGAGDVLARLTPIDAAAMAPGEAARSLVGHMPALILRTDEGWELMAFRSMAGTLAHDLGRAMRGIAARMAAT